MVDWPTRMTQLDRFLGRFTRLRPAEGRSVVAFFAYALLMMLSYYILKTIREPLLLTGPSAEIKSYAYAATAAVLLVIVPLYGFAFRHTGKQQLTRYVTAFFLLNLLLFWIAGRAGLDIGFAYYVWVGVFSVFITAQFWGFAADSYNVKSGQRLFPLIMVGATLGGLLAPSLSGALFPALGPWLLMLAATVLLALTLPLVGWSRRLVPPGSRGLGDAPGERRHGGVWGGLALVFSDRYLLLLAVLILLLNWVNTTGEYILAELVVRQADAQLASADGVPKADFIAAFYGNFFFTVNLLTLLAQVFLVALDGFARGGKIVGQVGLDHRRIRVRTVGAVPGSFLFQHVESALQVLQVQLGNPGLGLEEFHSPVPVHDDFVDTQVRGQESLVGAPLQLHVTLYFRQSCFLGEFFVGLLGV